MIVQVEILGDAYASAHDVHKVFAYRYNTPAPGVIAGSYVEHASDNWMIFLGQIAGCVFSNTRNLSVCSRSRQDQRNGILFAHDPFPGSLRV